MKTRILLILFIVFSLSPEAFPGPDDSIKLRNLPIVLTTTPIHNENAPVAFLISGDGGWYHFEQSIAKSLAEKGIPTIGLDSRKYFWKRRTPDETAADMALALSYYAKEWHRKKFVFIGYSLGAEIVPFIVNRLPEEIKIKIQSAALLSPDVTTDFEIHISNMLGMGNKQNTYNTIEEIIKMQDIPTLIIFGEGEKTRVPELLAGTTMKIRKIPGDHHYKSNLPLIFRTLNENLEL